MSESNVEPVKRYIAHQAADHDQLSFEEKFRLLCRRHGVDIDERYAWD